MYKDVSNWAPDFPIIWTGPSPRSANGRHAVIAQDGVMIHDPHPDGTGLRGGKPDRVYYLVPMNPSSLRYLLEKHHISEGL